MAQKLGRLLKSLLQYTAQTGIESLLNSHCSLKVHSGHKKIFGVDYLMKLLIIADDFTGALDTGIQFSKRGIPVRVCMIRDLDLDSACKDVEVLVVNTESRHISAKDAYSIVYKLTKDALNIGVPYIYKKTDSTLRGNIGSELSAVVDASGGKIMMFIPAYPGMNRTTENAIQYVEGVPVDKSAFAKDILNPMKQSYIPDIINQQRRISVKPIKSFDDAVNARVNENNKQIYVFDAKTNTDLFKIGEFLQQNGMIGFTSGCAGFADVLSQLIPFSIDLESVAPKFGDKALIISGSLNEKSMKQLQYGIDSGYPTITLTPKQKLDINFWHSSCGYDLIKKIKAHYEHNNLVIIRTAENEQDRNETDSYAKDIGVAEIDNISSLIAKNMGTFVKSMLKEVDIPVLVVFGGDTALGIIKAIGCKNVIPKGELETGVAISEITFNKKSLLMVTKAGGFGSVEILGEIERCLKEEKPIC